MSSNFTIRPASLSDAEALLNIYIPYVLETAITFEYETPSTNDFTLRMEQILSKFPYLTALENNVIVGYAYASPFKSRAAYDWSLETSIYVAKEKHGLGIGKLLYQELERYLSLQNICNLCACIAYPNPQSIAFHERFGYKTVAHFTKSGYKAGKWYDMVWMEKPLIEHSIPPKPFIPFSNLIESGVSERR